MATFQKSYPLFSACGLNCGLCPRHHTDGASRCPGCCGEDFASKRPTCGIISCAVRHGGLEYCFLCEEYPCVKYNGVDETDSFITHKNMLTDARRAKAIGIDAYRAELDEKVAVLRALLAGYNDGRRKSFFCAAVNLLPLADVRAVMAQLEAKALPTDIPLKEKSADAAALFQAMADERGIPLVLRKRNQ